MSYNPADNPRLHPEINGRARRHVKRTQIVRPIRLDIGSDRALLFVCGQLKSPENYQDLCSTSMAVRRAVRFYSKHIERLDPSALFNERITVRRETMMPRGPRKRKANTVAPATPPSTL